MIFGTFDHLHAGHENYIKQAREHGDYVIAVVARDKTVRKIKNKEADMNEKKRLNALKDTGWADKVILGNLDDKHKVVVKYKPDVIALGYDQYAFTFRLEKTIIENKLNTKIVRMEAYKPDIYKSSIIKANEKKNKAQQKLSFT